MPERHLGLRRVALGQRARVAPPARSSEVVTPISGARAHGTIHVSFAAAVLRRVDHERAGAEGDAGERRGQHAPGRRRSARRTAAGRRGAGSAGRRSPSGASRGETIGCATHMLGSATTARRAASTSSRRACGQMTTPTPAVPGARLDDELLEAVERLAQAVGLREVVGAHGRHGGLLAQVEADHVLDVGVHELVVGHAGAERVDHAERARARAAGSEQAAERRCRARSASVRR